MDRKKGRKKRLVKLIILIITIIISGYLLSHKNQIEKINFGSLFSSATPKPVFCKENKLPANSLRLEEAIQSEISGTNGIYGIVIKNLKTNEFYSQNPDVIFDSESLYKLWVMAVVYKQIEEKKLNENQKLNDSYANLNKEFYIDPDIAEKTDGQISVSVGDALEQMITVSDNYSALILTDTVGLYKVKEFLVTNCFTHSKIGTQGNPPKTTALDISYFFEKLYKNKLADKKSTEKMINLLKEQKFIDKIPKYLPYNTQLSVAHKTGELDPFSHDGGIVLDSSGDYIIVVLSKSGSIDLANERIANVSKAVFNYFYPENREASNSAR